MFHLISGIVMLACFAWFVSRPGFEPFVGFLAGLATYFRNEVHGFIGGKFIALTPKSSVVKDFEHHKYSFCKREYIHPRIVEDLGGLLSDTGAPVVAINIAEANQSNRNLGSVEVKETQSHQAVSASIDGETFAYQYIGRSFSGIHILLTWNHGSGSGVFYSLLFVTISEDQAISFEGRSIKKSKRYVIKRLGALALGDRYKGKINYKFGFLTIKKDTGLSKVIDKNIRLLVL